jgi:uncharacterized delta-60 repeat protein
MPGSVLELFRVNKLFSRGVRFYADPTYGQGLPSFRRRTLMKLYTPRTEKYRPTETLAAAHLLADARTRLTFESPRVRAIITPGLQTLACLLFAALTSLNTHAAPTDLDTSFASGGIERRENSGQNQYDGVVALALQSDGKTVVVSSCLRGVSTPDICLYRLNVNGSADTSFAGGGTVVTPLAGNWYAPLLIHNARVALQSNGKIVIATTCDKVATGDDFCLARYHSNGVIDTSFGNAGVVVTSIAAGTGSDVLSALAIDSLDRIVAAGGCEGVGTSVDFCLARFNATTGAPDTTFGSGGKVLTTFAPSVALDEQINAIAISANGNITVVGQCSRVGTGDDVCLAQFRDTGAVKTSFGASGVIHTSASAASGVDRAYALAIQFDGKLLVAGECGGSACLLRYFGNGEIDGSFDAAYANTGIVRIAFPGVTSSYVNAVTLLTDGRILTISGCNTATVSGQICIARHWPEGFVDTTFAATGAQLIATTPTLAGASSLLIQPDGKPIFGGTCSVNTQHDSCVVRLMGNPNVAKQCSLDVDGDGVVRADIDAIIFSRAMFGFDPFRIVQGIVFPANATRNDWSSIRGYLINQCGMSIRPQ